MSSLRSCRTIGRVTASRRLLEAEQARSERLLRNPLPMCIAERLKQLFSSFDALTEARGLEKIKTIGDT
jgi:hypothetical protein